MLTIFNDPQGITGRTRHAFDFGLTLQANIERHLSAGGDCELLINGQKVDPLTDPRLDAPPSVADSVVVVRRPATGIEIAAYVIVALSVVAALSAPKVSGDAVINESPNNKLTGQTNIARTYQGIPDVYGHPRVWPDLIQPSVVEYIGNVKYVTEWLCVSRGGGTISDVKYAETPIDDIDGAEWSQYQPAGASPYPEMNTTTLTDVLEAFATPDVNGQELKGTGDTPDPIYRAGNLTYTGGEEFTIAFTDEAIFDNIKALTPSDTFTISRASDPDSITMCWLLDYTVASGIVTFRFGFSFPTTTLMSAGPGETFIIQGFPAADATEVGPFTLPFECDRIRWNLAFLRGLKGTALIKAEWWKIDGSGAEISGTRENTVGTFTGDTYSQQFFTETVVPSAGFGRYRIKFQRTNTPNSTGSDVAKLEEVYAMRHYATKELPGVTVIRVRTKATAQATGFSDRKFNLRFNRHVRTLTSTAVSASRNFARAMVHLWCVAGEDLAQIDTTQLAAINAEFGENDALLRFDGTLDDAQMSLGERLQRIADTARCALWRDGTQWTVTRDQARATPELQLDYRNLAASGDSAISYAAHLPASFDGVEVEYTDETTLSSKAYARLSIASGSVTTGTPQNPKKISMPGCATTSQATNRAHLEARRLLYQRTTVRDTALSDGGQLGVGSLVRWIDPNDFAGDDGLQAGEVLSISGAVIQTSEPIDWRGEPSGRILFTGINGQHLGAPVLCTPHASGGVQLDALPSGIYVADADRQAGSRYAFAVGLTEAETMNSGLYTVIETTPDSNRTVAVTLANYDQRMYEFDALALWLGAGGALAEWAGASGAATFIGA